MPQAVKMNNARVTVRILVVFGLTFLAVLALMLTQSLLSTPATFNQALRGVYVCMLVSAGLTAAALVVSLLLSLRRHAGARLAWIVTFLLFVFSGCCLMLHVYYIDAVRILNPALLALAVLYLVYLIFPREFFTQSMLVAFCAAGLFVVSRLFGRGSSLLAYIGLALLLCAVVLFAFLVPPVLKNGKGSLRLFGYTFTLAQPKASYDAFLITAGVMGLAMLAAAVCGFFGVGYTGSFWALLAAAAYLFILAVYYTVKLMVAD